jgi:hypothetical protein
MSEKPALRVVPGAPESVTSKSQRKRRKGGSKAPPSPATAVPDATSAALLEQAPDATSVREGSVAPELVAESTTPAPADEERKKSSVWELVNKRQKATQKKIVRVFVMYSYSICIKCT